MKTAPAAAAGALNPGVMAIALVFLGQAILGDRVGGVRSVGLAATATGIALFAWTGGASRIGQRGCQCLTTNTAPIDRSLWRRRSRPANALVARDLGHIP